MTATTADCGYRVHTLTFAFVFYADVTIDIGGDLAPPVTDYYPEGAKIACGTSRPAFPARIGLGFLLDIMKWGQMAVNRRSVRGYPEGAY